MRWIIADQKKYLVHVNHLREFVDDIESMTKWNQSAFKRQDRIINDAIEELDEKELEKI